ncbi:hypothetical protein AB0D08_27545 [Kitasatospora sp. NPDC048540]|uniref:hypothetical protein n=1 Tax=Kitasatospora sp. NPDC048540 TaxID=3155634 RepID=UPI003409DE8A
MIDPLTPVLILTRQHPRRDEQREQILVHPALEPHRQHERTRPTLTIHAPTRADSRLSAAPGGALAGLPRHRQGLQHPGIARPQSGQNSNKRTIAVRLQNIPGLLPGPEKNGHDQRGGLSLPGLHAQGPADGLDDIDHAAPALEDGRVCILDIKSLAQNFALGHHPVLQPVVLFTLPEPCDDLLAEINDMFPGQPLRPELARIFPGVFEVELLDGLVQCLGEVTGLDGAVVERDAALQTALHHRLHEASLDRREPLGRHLVLTAVPRLPDTRTPRHPLLRRLVAVAERVAQLQDHDLERGQ